MDRVVEPAYPPAGRLHGGGMLRVSPGAPVAALISIVAFYFSGFAWNFGLGMTYVLVPLYARSLGFSGMAIGALVSLPVLVQIGLALVAGAYTDRLGGMRLAVGSCLCMLGAGIVFAVSGSMAGLMVAQSLFIVSRAFYWPSTWAMAADLPGDQSKHFGRVNALASIGQILGTVVAGVIVEWFGYRPGFWMFAAMGVASAASLAAFKAPPLGHRPRVPLLANYVVLMKRRLMVYGILCAYISALPFSLSSSFYPILLVEIGYTGDETGTLLALRGVGAAAAGVVVGYFVKRTDEVRWPLLSAVVVGLSILLAAVFTQPVPIAVFLLCVGLGSSVMTIYFQLLMTESSSPTERGSAMALGGLGWGLSHFSTPLLMGWMNDAIGVIAAFQVMGAIAVSWGALLYVAYRWSRPRRHHAVAG